MIVPDECGKEDGKKCEHGACLDEQCHCNDGFGGCSCELPGIYLIMINYNIQYNKLLIYTLSLENVNTLTETFGFYP